MNKIAVLLGSSNKTISFNQSGVIKVFEKEEKRWKVTQEIELLIEETMGLKEIRECLQQAAEQIKDCKIIVGKKVYGLSYNIFEVLQFNIWEFQGAPETFLDYILEQEEQAAKEEQERKIVKEQQKEAYVNQIDSEYYVIDLMEMQHTNKNISSKQAIIPLLKKGVFKKLDIICSHIPSWIEDEVKKYPLKIDTEKLGVNHYIVKLSAVYRETTYKL